LIDTPHWGRGFAKLAHWCPFHFIIGLWCESEFVCES
jgi:hypothetical protein